MWQTLLRCLHRRVSISTQSSPLQSKDPHARPVEAEDTGFPL